MTDSTVDTTLPADVAPVGTASRSADSLVVDIVERLAAARGVDPLDLPPLNDYIDVDALATLFQSASEGGELFGAIRFQVEDHEVRVYHDGTIYVHRPDSNGLPSTAGSSC